MLFMYVCLNGAKCARWAGPEWQRESKTAEVNILCNQQMTTQKMEGAEIEGLAGCGGGKGRSTNMIIASIFAFFYFCLFQDLRNHPQSILPSPFFMFLCFAVLVIQSALSLLECPAYLFPSKRYRTIHNAIFTWSCSPGHVCSQFTVHVECTVNTHG